MSEYLKDIPEFYERELGESIIARTEALGNIPPLYSLFLLRDDSSLSTPPTLLFYQAPFAN